MVQFVISYLDEEPKRNSKFKQFLFNFTRPVAQFLDSFDLDKQLLIHNKRKAIASMNKKDYIEEVAQILYDEVSTYGKVKDVLLCKMLCIDEAREIFNERKQNGGFDDLNIMS